MRIPSSAILLVLTIGNGSLLAADRPVTLDAGLGQLTHPISTKSEQAQAFFDQGLRYLYAFNHEESVRSFTKAAELDPSLAMAHWGMALALGPNINIDVDPEHEKQSYDAIQKAIALRDHASAEERDLIDALAKRYSNDPKADLKKLAADYHDAMKSLAKKYPDDLDLVVLYAESTMDLNPWKFWDAQGKPAPGTEEIVSTLESVLRRDPNHIGANHYYIHAVEASSNPERGLISAQRLKTLAPQAGHLVHMPAHIYARTGDFEEAAAANRQGIKADEEYVKKAGSENLYSLVYYTHNYQFLSAAAAMEGRFAEAKMAADQVALNIGPMVSHMAMIEGMSLLPEYVLLRFHKYREVLLLPAPAEGLQAKAGWRFARAMAFAGTGKVSEAKQERQKMNEVVQKIPADAPFLLNTARDIFALSDVVLGARIAEAEKKPDAIDQWRHAVELQDKTSYDEPSDWFYPIRESLGAALLRAGRTEDAEAVFREDLNRNPRNGRSLFGLMTALERQDKSSGVSQVKRELGEAWKNADTTLKLDDL
ncbi:MAG TPA: hypothetical protein VHL58_06390 [Thermoanaerobaculia bacterium]|nr:hypothetical protein [Thermoanaerobaculia bacterium]